MFKFNRYQKNLELEHDIFDVLDENGHINGQMKYPINKMSFGAVNAGFASCELIAIYNVLKDKNIKIYFSDLIKLAEKNNYLFAFGIFGTKINKIKNILDYFNVDYISISVNDFYNMCCNNLITEGSSYIAVIKNNKNLPISGIHTFEMTFADDHWIVYNRFNNLSSCSIYNKIEDILRNGNIKATFIKILKIL